METLKKRIAIPLLVLLMAGCTVKLTREQQLLWANDVYLAQYEMYLDQVLDPNIVPEDRAMLKADPKLITEDMIRPDLSEEQRVILRKKKPILIDAKKYLEMAADYRERGELAPVELQNTITNLINSLL